ncbi:MAG: PKD domain-containing protein [Flavobacteriales bacterium]
MKYLLKTTVLSILVCCFISTVAGQGKLGYVKNEGQWESKVQYKAAIGGGYVWLEKDRFTFLFQNQHDLELFHEAHEGVEVPLLKQHIRMQAFALRFIGSNQTTGILGTEKKREYHNYFLGSDKTKWRSNVGIYETVNYANFYNGISLKLHSDNGYLKYDFVVAPGANPAAIKWKYEGIKAEIQKGEIHLNSEAGLVIEKAPIAWQEINGERKNVPCTYVLEKGEVSFVFPNGYDKKHELIIDPTLVFSSYTGSTADNWGFTATYDNTGHLYSGGIVFAAGYPTTMGAFQTAFGGGTTDVGISKFTPTGTTLVFSTYLGGNAADVPHSLFVDINDNLYVYGTTASTNFPTLAGSYDVTHNGGTNVAVNGINYAGGSDIYVARFDATGSALLAATYIGGTANDGLNVAATLKHNYADQNRGEIVVDANGDVFVASSTMSVNFPVTPGSFGQTAAGTQDGCAFKMDANLTTLQWSSYIGGSLTDAAYSIKAATNGDVFVCGGTNSTNFQTSGTSLISTAPGGTADAYILSLSGSNGSYVNSTYLGTNNYDQAYLLEIDVNGDIYVFGQTKGAYPITGGVYSNPNSAQFIHKVNPALSATGFSTIFGSGTITNINISPTAFLVDNCRNIYACGWGGAVNSGAGGNTNNLPLTTDAYDATTDGSDFYFIVLSPNAGSLLYGTYFGGAVAEHVDGGTSRFDKNGVVYQAVCAGCGGNSNFPTTPGVWSNTNNSSNCNLGAFKIAFSYTGVVANANAAPNIIACDPPYNVNFTGSNVPDHIWNFDDGSPVSTLQNPAHTFTDTGSYTIMYIAIDSASCNIADTAYLSVIILEPQQFSGVFDIPPFNPCTDDTLFATLEFTGTGADSLVWNMGDGTIYYDDTLVNHPYTVAGTYIITLTAYDFDCGLMESMTDTITFATNTIIANANASPNIITCDPPFTVNFSNGGGSSPQHLWNFDDGAGTSTLPNPSYTFTDTGTFNVMYIAIDSASCNLSDTSYVTVVILEAEDFSALFSPIPPQPCSDTVYINVTFTGTGADSLVWNMGDSTIFINQQSITYAYYTPGVYTMQLTAWDFTCNKTETISQVIEVGQTTVFGEINIPNVFSPNADDKNKKFALFYAGMPGVDPLPDLEHYAVSVYDRWGLLMFKSSESIPAWDGKVDGKEVPAGVYYYLAEYKRRCWDDEITIKKGHVTVLR